MEDKQNDKKNHLQDNTKTEPSKMKKLSFSTWIALKTAWNLRERIVLPRKKSERRLKLLTEFLSKTLKTKAANFEGSPKGKNCWYIFWNS